MSDGNLHDLCPLSLFVWFREQLDNTLLMSVAAAENREME